MGRKKVDRWRHQAELVNQGATLVFFRCFCPAVVNDSTMHDAFIWCCHQRRKLLMCVPDMLHPNQLGNGLTMTYRQQSIRWWEAERPEPIYWSCGILILSATGKKWFQCFFELLVHFNPLQQGALCTGSTLQIHRWVFGACQMQLCRTQVGHMASLAKKSIAYTLRSYPSANLWNPKLKAGVTEVQWSVEIAYPTSVWFPSCPNQ